MKELILGGVRSGKSRLAEEHALASGLAVTLIATATADDEEMRQRIRLHQQRRPSAWTLVEEPLALAAALRAHAAPYRCLLVDCLTLWLTNLLCSADQRRLQTERDALLAALPGLPGHIILVGNETNMGIMPPGELTRRYCDEAGLLHQELARRCNHVVLTVAGLPLILK
ncbi:MAG: bifunctional adenosylcobinamide kinase/adenosylcobinamide-phosphate guanylyltransferase [Sulfuricellaceae bacterium]